MPSIDHGNMIVQVLVNHDDVIKWKHFPRNWPFVRGIHRSPVNSPDNGQWRGALMFSLICAWIKTWVNNGEAGDLRRYRAHYDVIVMLEKTQWILSASCTLYPCPGGVTVVAWLQIEWNRQGLASFTRSNACHLPVQVLSGIAQLLNTILYSSMPLCRREVTPLG